MSTPKSIQIMQHMDAVTDLSALMRSELVTDGERRAVAGEIARGISIERAKGLIMNFRSVIDVRRASEAQQ